MTDDGTFDEFYRSARERLVVQIAALTGDPAEAQDHVQDAFVRAWARWDRISGYDDPEGWVRRAAYHRAVSTWRRARKILLRAEAPPAGPHLDPDQFEVIEALRKLPARERQALVLRGLAGLSVADIAEELSAPEGTVKSWLSRGRERLTRELSAADGEVVHDSG